MYDALEGRYGRKAAIAVFAAGHVVGLATPLVVLPGSTVIGMAPFAAMAEIYLQAKKGIGKLLGKYAAEEDLSEEQVQRLAKEMVEEIQAAWQEYMGNQAGHYARDWTARYQRGEMVPYAEIEEAASMLAGSGQYVAWNSTEPGGWEVVEANVMGHYSREAGYGGVTFAGRWLPDPETVGRYAKKYRSDTPESLFKEEDHPRADDGKWTSGTGHASKGPDEEKAKPTDHKATVLAAFDKLAAGPKGNFVDLADLHDATGLPIADLHAAVQELRRDGTLTGSGREGRHGVSDKQKAASIKEKDGEMIGFVSRRNKQ